MFTNGFNTEGIFTMTKMEKGNELNRFCKLEGMNYQQLISEVHGLKTQPVKGRHMRLFSAFSNHTR